jgi:chromate reductase
MSHILALSGSLRSLSSNTAVLRVASLVAPPGVDVELHPGLDALPFFNPDLDRKLDDPALPAAVQSLRRRLGAADVLIISSPEYAHGISGLMKNALDWLVGGAEMVGKPVGIINTSPHATHALDALRETLRTMTANVVDEACIAIAVPRNCDDAELAADTDIADPLRDALARLVSEASHQEPIPPAPRVPTTQLLPRSALPAGCDGRASELLAHSVHRT